jgi:hypothetical protein
VQKIALDVGSGNLVNYSTTPKSLGKFKPSTHAQIISFGRRIKPL